jgi:hypothetical protein
MPATIDEFLDAQPGAQSADNFLDVGSGQAASIDEFLGPEPPPERKKPGAIDLFNYHVADKTNLALQGLFRGMAAITNNEENRKDAENVATGLEKYRTEKLLPSFGVQPEDLKSTTSKVVGAAANVFDIAPGPAVMIAKLAGETYGSTYNHSVQRQQEDGVTDEEAIKNKAREEARNSVVEMAPVLALYAAGGKVAKLGADWLLPETTAPLLRAGVGGTTAAGANIAASSAIRKAKGGPFLGDLEQNLTDIFFGATGGLHELGRAPRKLSADQFLDQPTGEEQILATGDVAQIGQTKSRADLEQQTQGQMVSGPGPEVRPVSPPIDYESEISGLETEIMRMSPDPLVITAIQHEATNRGWSNAQYLSALRSGIAKLKGETQPSPAASGSEEPTARREVVGQAPRFPTPEENAQAEYYRELEQDARAMQASTGDELISAVVRAGGLPSKLNPVRKSYSGEIANLEESVRDPLRTGAPLPPINKLFTATAPHPDELATRLRDQGFNVQTPDDVFALLDTRLRTGKEIFGQPAAAEFYSPKATEAELVDLERQGRDLVQEFQGEYGGGTLPGQERLATERPEIAPGQAAISDIASRVTERGARLQQNREALAKTIKARNVQEEFAAEGVTTPEARRYGQNLVAEYAEAIRTGKLPQQPRYPIYREVFSRAEWSPESRYRADQYITAGDHALRIVEESLAQHGFKPKEDIYFAPRKRRGGIAPIPPPPVPPGQVLTMGGDLPVTMPRTRPGSIAASDVMDALKKVMVTSGSVGEIRRGRFQNIAKGVFKSRPEIVRLEHIDDVPTAVHETGHALMKQFYGTVKSRGLKWAPTAVRRELIGLGKELYGNRKPAAGYTSEGFSEFIRHYLTSDSAGRTVAPNTYNFFEQGVLVDHSEVAAQLRRARDMIDIYRKQGAIERANTQLVREPGWTRRTLTALRDFFSFQKFAESAEPLRQLSIEARERTGKPLPSSADPYKLFKMKRGGSGPILDRMVEGNMVNVWGNPTGPSLKEALTEVQGQRNEFLLYLFARRAQERWSKDLNPGITKEDADYIRQTLESPRFDRAASKYYQWWDGVLSYLVQADPTMAPAVARIKQGSSDYAPLARMLDERAVRREAARAQSNPLYKMHGSGLPVKDIFDQTLISTARLISRANRQLVTNAVVKLAQIEGMGRLIENVPQDKVRRSLNIEQIRQDLEKMGVDTTSIPEDELLNYYTPADQPQGTDPIVAVKQPDGTSQWYYVDPKIYDVMNKIEPFSLRTIPHLGPAIDFVLGAPKRIFTMGTTGLRPTFSLVTNPLRDPQGWLLQTKAGINPAKMVAAYFNAVGEQLRGALTGRTGPLTDAALNLGPQMSQALGRDIQYTRKASKALFHGRFMRVITSPVDHLRQLLNLPESFPRLAEFKRVGDEIGWKPGDSMSPDQAVELAIAFKEATVDFSAAGDVSRIVNEAVPFFNPNIQGVRTAARAFRDHPLRTTLLGLASFTGPTLWLWWKNKDKEWYRNLPWRERYYYTNIDDGKNVWQIPRPFEWGNLFAVLPEAALDSWYRQDPRAVTEAFGNILQTQNPFDYPVVLRLMKEQWENRIDFWDRPIVPKSEVDLAPSAQVGPYTSKVATWLGQAFPNQVSPRRVDAAICAFAGGAVPDVLDAIGLGAQKKTRDSELADLPVVGRLWRRGGFYNAQSQQMADFWDIKQGVDARVAAMNLQIKDPSRIQTIPLNARDVAMAPVLDKAGQDIAVAMRLANLMRESAGRQRMYKSAADEAKMLVDLWYKQEQSLAQSQQGR